METPTIAEEKKEEVTAAPAEPSQVDPIKQELEKVQGKKVRTEAEKAAFSLQNNAKRAKELGLDPAEILGFAASEAEPVDESTPVTVGMLKKIEEEKVQKTALQLADSITDENERELTKHYLEERIRPSGDPQADLNLARGMVNAVKTGQILEEVERDRGAKTHASGAGAPAKVVKDGGELTAAELPYMKPPWNMTKEAIIAARPKT